MTMNKEYFNYLYDTLDIPATVNKEKIISDILKTFSAYISYYDNDYLYNYKFIVSHIEDFVKCWNKSVSIISICEKLKDILLGNTFIYNFCKFISQYRGIKLSILINDAIEIHSSSNIDVLRIKRKQTLSNKSISYKDEIDISIKLISNSIEFQRDYFKVHVSELSDNNNTTSAESISIIHIIEGLIKELFYYIININDLSSLIKSLKLIDYAKNNIEDLCIQFDHFLEYYPFRESTDNNSTYVFKFSEHLHKHESINFKIENIYAICKNIDNQKFHINSDLNYIEQFNKIFKLKEV